MTSVRTWIFAGGIALGLVIHAPVARAQTPCSSSNGTGDCLSLVAAPFLVVVMMADAFLFPGLDLMTPPFSHSFKSTTKELQGIGIFEAAFCGLQALIFTALATNPGVVVANYPSTTKVILGIFAIWTGILATHGVIAAIVHTGELAQEREREKGHPGETVLSSALPSPPRFPMPPEVGGPWRSMVVVASF